MVISRPVMDKVHLKCISIQIQIHVKKCIYIDTDTNTQIKMYIDTDTQIL